jgi:high-affinity Fe2+/Pb2+ permease
MEFENQFILEIKMYGVLCLVVIAGMLWMVFDEKRKYNKTNGKK